MFSLPRDTVDVPIPPGPARQRLRVGLSRQDQRLVDQRPPPLRLLPGTKDRPRGYNGLKAILGELYEPRHQVLRRGQLRRLQEGRRRHGRRDDQRPGPGLRRPLPVDRRPAAPGLHPERDPAHERRRGAPLRPLAPRLDRLRPRRAPAARAAVAARAGRPAGPHPAPPRADRRRSSRRSRPTSRSTSSRRCSGSPRRSTPRTSARTSSRRRSTRANTCPDPRGYVVVPKIGRIRAAVKNAFTADPADEAHAPERSPRRPPGCGSSTARATRPRGAHVAGYLDYHGLAASAPRQKPPGAVPANTTIVVYNGAEDEAARDDRLPRADVRGDGRRSATDPAIRTDIIITVGKTTPEPRGAALS